MKIKTAFGDKIVGLRVGNGHGYVWTLPERSAPNGEWWTLNPQRGWVPVPSNSRALLDTLRLEGGR